MIAAFAALATPTRRQILDLLRERVRPEGDLVAQTGFSQPNPSNHLRVPREAGLFAVRQDAQRLLCRLRPAPLAEINGWLQQYRPVWPGRREVIERDRDARAAGSPCTLAND